MTDPAGGAPTPPPPSGNYGAPPPQGGFNPNFQQPPVEAGPAPGIVYADIVTRIIALVIDSIILYIPYIIVAGIFITALFATGGAIATVFALVIGVAYAALAGAYFVWTWTTQRASYGMKFLKLEVVNAADGATLTQPQAIRRFLYLYAGNLIAIVGQQVFGFGLGSLCGLIGLVYVVYLLYTTSQSAKRQGFHDLQAGTVVIKHL
jgi:uncharacterized RDD family membrane protein YckC